MGCICDIFQKLFAKKKLSPLKPDSKLYAALRMKKTVSGHDIHELVVKVAQTERQIKEGLERPEVNEDMRYCYSPPVSNFDKLTAYLYLTSIGGITQENIAKHNIIMIINATYEWPLIQNETITSYRVPVDDADGDDISIYFDEVADKIHECRQLNGSCIVHCMAGASRSTTLVLAYLMKYEEMSLKSSYNSVRKRRDCARPNLGFWQQLIQFEQNTRGKTSVKILSLNVNGFDVKVPDIYKESHQDFYRMVIDKQIELKMAKQENPNLRTKSQRQFNPDEMKYV